MIPEEDFRIEVCERCGKYRGICPAETPNVVNCSLVLMALCSYKTMVVLGTHVV